MHPFYRRAPHDTAITAAVAISIRALLPTIPRGVTFFPADTQRDNSSLLATKGGQFHSMSSSLTSVRPARLFSLIKAAEFLLDVAHGSTSFSLCTGDQRTRLHRVHRALVTPRFVVIARVHVRIKRRRAVRESNYRKST